MKVVDFTTPPVWTTMCKYKGGACPGQYGTYNLNTQMVEMQRRFEVFWCLIFRIEMSCWFLILFCGMGGRECCWLTFQPQYSRLLWRAHIMSCLHTKRAHLLLLYMGLYCTHSFPGYRDTELSNTIKLPPPP